MWLSFKEKLLKSCRTLGCALCSALIPAVAVPPKLIWLKCANHHPKGNPGYHALQTEQLLVCRVTSRYNHRFSDRTNIPRTKASPEILQPQFYNTGKVVITASSRHYYKTKLSKPVIQTIRVKLQSLNNGR